MQSVSDPFCVSTTPYSCHQLTLDCLSTASSLCTVVGTYLFFFSFHSSLQGQLAAFKLHHRQMQAAQSQSMSAAEHTDMSQFVIEWQTKRYRETSDKVIIDGQEFPLDAPVKLKEDEIIFSATLSRHYSGFRKNPLPALPLDYLPSTWAECMADFEVSSHHQICTSPDMSVVCDEDLKALAERVLQLWDEMVSYLRKKLKHRASKCKYAKECTHGTELLGLRHALCSLHAGVFGKPQVVEFFIALNQLCRACDFSFRREFPGRIYTVFGSLVGEHEQGTIAHLLAAISEQVYTGMGLPLRPFSHFQAAAKAYSKGAGYVDESNDASEEGVTSTVAYLRDCYAKKKVPYLATAHGDKSYLFAQLMEGCNIRYLCFDRRLDMANQLRGAYLPPLMAYLLPAISDNCQTFDMIATLHNLHLMLVDSASNLRAIAFKEAVQARKLHNKENVVSTVSQALLP